MSYIQEFEFYHGIVLTKLLRKKGLRLSLIEFDQNAGTALYNINDEFVQIKYRRLDKGSDKVWQFTFSEAEGSRLNALISAGMGVNLALVCGLESTDPESRKNTHICLLHKPDIIQTVDFSRRKGESIRVRAKEGGSLRVFGKLREKDNPLIVPRNRISSWELPK